MTPIQPRLHYLDAVRAFALLLGVVFHASLSFMPMFIGWAVMDISTSNVVAIFALISHSFRMELFFLIAGFFSQMKLQQQGLQAFLKSRWVRIGIPFLIGWIVLRPMLVSGWIIGAESMRGEANVLDGLVQGVASLISQPESWFVGTHLWFLYYLLKITGLALLLTHVCKPIQNTQLGTKIENAFAWCCRSHFGILALAMPTTLCLWFMDSWSVDTPDNSLLPDGSVLLLYLGFYGFGVMLHKQSLLLNDLAKLSWLRVLTTIVAIVGCVMLSPFQGQLAHEHIIAIKIAYLVCYALMMWSLIMLVIGAGKQLFKKPNRWVRYFADASYWIYLIHLPIVIWLQIAVAELELHWAIKWSSVVVLACAISIVLFEIFVKKSIVGKVLSGRTSAKQVA